ncbi:hypothetical protein NEOLI_001044 [Neolecta irregularis DAH-3]|uniref:Uncharacterized protein n=1 Tax=Neolecta irregularis (strain DAH-3) TaxID=1198029 RepID=A0A1U7LGP2_NEOID|nr:hypothetical protein NEOLI_001044 [Neolecta irregularis DAH-3]|eukprot:OLL21826.1 hypothetical protein NEOLI_001044 [Neolecta irregularis DAH-3]
MARNINDLVNKSVQEKNLANDQWIRNIIESAQFIDSGIAETKSFKESIFLFRGGFYDQDLDLTMDEGFDFQLGKRIQLGKRKDRFEKDRDSPKKQKNVAFVE